MEEIYIPYEEHYNIWARRVQEGLDRRDIIFTDEMLINICKSIRQAICDYLILNNYSASQKQCQRRILVNKLKDENKQLVIKSNRILWLYLEYFTDVIDYRKCFDIYVEDINYEKRGIGGNREEFTGDKENNR